MNMPFTNLQSLMKIEGITIDSLANTLNIHRNTLTKKIAGVYEFTFDEINKIKAIFNKYNFDYVFARETLEVEEFEPIEV